MTEVTAPSAALLKEARASVDPSLLYHVNRVPTKKKKTKILKQRVASQAAFLETLKTVPVIRMVVAAGGKSGKVEVERIKHGRDGAVYKEDLHIVVAGQPAFVELFGKKIGEAVFKLKARKEDDEAEDLEEEGYDDVSESQEWDGAVV